MKIKLNISITILYVFKIVEKKIPPTTDNNVKDENVKYHDKHFVNLI